MTSKPTSTTKKATKAAPRPAKKAVVQKPARKSTTAEAKPASREKRASKRATVITLLKRADGATAQEIMDATGWQRHTVRGFLSVLGKTVKIARDAEGRYRAE